MNDAPWELHTLSRYPRHFNLIGCVTKWIQWIFSEFSELIQNSVEFYTNKCEDFSEMDTKKFISIPVIDNFANLEIFPAKQNVSVKIEIISSYI